MSVWAKHPVTYRAYISDYSSRFHKDKAKRRIESSTVDRCEYLVNLWEEKTQEESFAVLGVELYKDYY